MDAKTKTYLIDLAERVGWTIAQVVVGVLAVESADWDPAWAVPIAAGLAVLKGVIAKHVGSDQTAAMLPRKPDTEAGGLGDTYRGAL